MPGRRRVNLVWDAAAQAPQRMWDVRTQANHQFEKTAMPCAEVSFNVYLKVGFFLGTCRQARKLMTLLCLVPLNNWPALA